MTTPYQHPGAASPTYASPIPVRSAHLGDALASEWTKIRSVRSTMWTLGVMIVLMVGIGLGTAAIVAASDVDLQGESALGFGFFGVLLGTICVITLGVLTIASEYGTGMIRTTLTACPSRSRVLAAKAIVFFGLVFTITAVFAALVAVVQTGMVEATEPTGDEWLRATVGVALFVASIGLLSLAVGTMIRHSAGAITIMIGVMLLPLVAAMFMFSESLADVQEFLLNYAIPSQLIGIYGEAAAGGSAGPVGWEPVWIVLGITAVAMGGAFAVLNSRDV
ncbi:ABC transporter permease subunit [Streptomyces sp. PKU-EA00015]|uniref:ABC transporter permease n=1 Tax=Streptomyces sp. PKU-EA00015 TaxID=2748326 RepID=UPI00159FD3D8|nr:ABC transporter permease [Streptomyces sp. PKU-EA00015]NWF25067.1 ABC transporter permease subunit [Streptomyces sp. PKU-EA00015]